MCLFVLVIGKARLNLTRRSTTSPRLCESDKIKGGLVRMKEIAEMNIALIEDRGSLKFRVNTIKDGKVMGFFKPAKSLV